MENISLAIVTNDKMYGKALGIALLNVCGTFLIKVFSWDEFVRERGRYYNQEPTGVFSSSFDMILWDGQEAEAAYGGKVILLTDDPARAVKNYNDKRFSLYKYSAAQTMVSSLFDIYSFLTGRRAANIKKDKVRMITFGACSGGVGCTSLAMAVGQELCRFQGRHVLYVSFEEVESTGDYINSSGGIKGAGVYLYHLFRSREGYPFLESYTVHDDFGLEAFSPTSGRNPLRNLNREEFGIFAASLIDSGRYDVIIMDIGNCLSEAGIACMEMTEKLCFVSLHGECSKREIQYLQHIICCCGEEVIDRMVKAENKVNHSSKPQIISADGEGMIETTVKISRFKEMILADNVKRIILEEKFGENIKELTEKLMEPSVRLTEEDNEWRDTHAGYYWKN